MYWISSYLTNRTQAVRVSGFISVLFRFTSGVPQGSHLGPILFILFMNEIVIILKFAKILMNADDIKLFKHIMSLTYCELLQADLRALQLWCNENNLEVTISNEMLSLSTGKGLYTSTTTAIQMLFWIELVRLP